MPACKFAGMWKNKAPNSGSETQRRHHQKSKTGLSVAPQKGLMSSKNFKKNIRTFLQVSHLDLIPKSKYRKKTKMNCWSPTSFQLFTWVGICRCGSRILSRAESQLRRPYVSNVAKESCMSKVAYLYM